MKRSLIAHFFAYTRATARMLMQQQHRSVANSAVLAELRTMPEYLQRDIGLIDGKVVLEDTPARSDQCDKRDRRWSDLVVTPHAA